jgi:heat shock protein HslJ
MNLRTVFCGLLPLALAACASAPGASESLDGTQWKLLSADRGTLAPLASASGVTLQFGADRVSGNGGCNRYNATYTLADGRLKLGPVIATKMACAGERNTAERAWFALLGTPLTVQREGDGLTLRSDDGTALSFAAAADAP